MGFSGVGGGRSFQTRRLDRGDFRARRGVGLTVVAVEYGAHGIGEGEHDVRVAALG